MLKRLIASFACLTIACQVFGDSARRSPAVLFSTSWENGISPRLQREAPGADAVRVVSLDDTAIPRALEVTIRRGCNYAKVAGGTPRAELVFSGIARFTRGREYVIDWQTYIPGDYVIDKQQSEVISQIHQGVRSGYPTFALFISEAGKYGVRTRSGEGRPSEGKQFGDPAQDRGRLVSWRLRYIPDDTGRLALSELTKDGEEVFKISGVPNAYASDDGAYFKLGLYKSDWQKRPSDVDVRKLYFGRISILRVD